MTIGYEISFEDIYIMSYYREGKAKNFVFVTLRGTRRSLFQNVGITERLAFFWVKIGEK